MLDNTRSETTSGVLARLLNLNVEFKAEGRKTSEGDGRTAADVEREVKQEARDGTE